jgi:hypothetical protein
MNLLLCMDVLVSRLYMFVHLISLIQFPDFAQYGNTS